MIPRPNSFLSVARQSRKTSIQSVVLLLLTRSRLTADMSMDFHCTAPLLPLELASAILFVAAPSGAGRLRTGSGPAIARRRGRSRNAAPIDRPDPLQSASWTGPFSVQRHNGCPSITTTSTWRRSTPQSDVIIRPQFNIDAIWPVTQLNTLKLDLGLGYSFYLEHPNSDTNGVLISPGSQLSFDIFVQDFRINLHDRFLLQQDPTAQLQLSNVVDYGRFENAAGISVLWDLNKAVLTFGYDHFTFVSTSNTFSYLDRNAEELNFSAYFALTSTTGAGLEASAVYNYYSQDFLNNSVGYNVGPFVETQITNYLKLRASVGYQAINFATGGGVDDSSDASNYYAYILLSHRIQCRDYANDLRGTRIGTRGQFQLHRSELCAAYRDLEHH